MALGTDYFILGVVAGGPCRPKSSFLSLSMYVFIFFSFLSFFLLAYAVFGIDCRISLGSVKARGDGRGAGFEVGLRWACGALVNGFGAFWWAVVWLWCALVGFTGL